MVDDEPMVFRPKPWGPVDFVWSIGCLTLGTAALILGIAASVVEKGTVSAWCCCAGVTFPLGVLLVFSGLRASTVQVTLDRKGFRRSPVMFGGFAFGGFAFKWKDVRGWWVGSFGRPNIHQAGGDEWDQEILRLEVPGRFFALAVDAYDVADPGFDAFVAAVHRFVPDRELTLPSHPYFKGGDC